MLLRSRLTVLFSIGIVLVVAVLLISNAKILSQSESRLRSAVISGKESLWQKIISSETNAMKAEMNSFTRDRKIRNALKKGDNKGVEENAVTTFRRLSTLNIINKLQVADAQGNIVYSASNSNFQQTDSTLIQQALASGKVAEGIDRHSDGEIVVQIAFPLLSRGKLVGAGLYSRGLQEAITDFKTNDGSDIFIVSKEGQNLLSTNNELYQPLGISFSDSESNSYSNATVADKTYAITTLPLTASSGAHIGFFVSASDYSKSYAAQSRIQTLSFIISFSIIALMIFISLWYIRRSFKPLELIIKNMDKISDGNLTLIQTSDNNDEIGRLQNAMANMSQGLKDIISEVRSMAKTMEKSVVQMDYLSQQTNDDIQAQLMQTEQVATAMSQMSSTVADIASSTADVSEAMDKTNSTANQGHEIVSQSIVSINNMASTIEQSSAAINKLEENSNDIGTVLDVIRGIAEQTNLLALNAAIEAARAGEQGRGFAVVADEVRTLATRTQQSTDDIQTMISQLQDGTLKAVENIDQSVKHVDSNVSNSNKTAESLSHIITTIHNINDMNKQIAEAAQQQSTVSEEINRSIKDIAQTANLCANKANETSEHSAEMNVIAKKMTKLVSHFQV